MAKAEVIPQGEWIAGDSNLHGEPVLSAYSLRFLCSRICRLTCQPLVRNVSIWQAYTSGYTRILGVQQWNS